jgi:hypothetical protein
MVTLAESMNVSGTLEALVEQSDQSVYFYILPTEQFKDRFDFRQCWIRNLKKAPVDTDIAGMQGGEGPMLPAAFCNHPEGKEPFTDDGTLSIVWFEEEDGAALMHNEEVLAIIPGWSLYMERPVAYSKDCIAFNEDLNVYPLGPDSGIRLLAQLNKTVSFWKEWEKDNTWGNIQQYFLQQYEAVFGPNAQYYAIDGGDWPPKALARFKKDNIDIFITLGVSIRPMPYVSSLYEQPEGFRRIELAIAVDSNEYSEDEIIEMAISLSGFVNIPWKNISWLGEGHTIDSAQMPPPFAGVVLSSAIYNGPEINLELFNDKINLLWAIPILQEEIDFKSSRDNGGFQLVEKMINQDVSWITVRRPAVETR